MCIDIWLDLAAVESYLGLNAFRKALAQEDPTNEVVVRVQPLFDLATQRLHEGRVLEVAEIAAKSGITLDEKVLRQPESPSTKAAQNVLAFVGETETNQGADALPLKLAEGILRARYQLGLDIGNPEVLVSVSQDYGLNGKAILQAAEDEGLSAAVEQEAGIGLYMGMTQTPTLVFNETTFVEGMQTETAYKRILRTALSDT